MGIVVVALAKSKEAADAATASAANGGGASGVSVGAARGGIPKPKGYDILRGFIELRKGIFWEKREKVSALARLDCGGCWR